MPGALKKFLRVGLHPLVLLLGVLSAALGLAAGYPPILVSASAGLFTILCCATFERLFPFEDSWNRSHGDVAVDLAHFIFSMLGMIALFQWLAFEPLRNLGQSIGLSIWPSAWPLWAQLILALFIAEFGYYWVHRLSHEVDFLWRFHATHHSVPRLYWFNGGHFHPLDTLCNYGAEVTPLLLLGAGPEVMVLFSVFTSANGMLKHSNIEFSLGPLNWLLSTAELHRWHHSKDAREGNTNYGSNLILWDLLFGTRFLPAQRPPAEIGLSGMNHFPQGFVPQLLSPINWKKLS
jgi:sterol desaturase/sphingolipid hydroxylase (fatty acid hydroxylase superfamily)